MCNENNTSKKSFGAYTGLNLSKPLHKTNTSINIFKYIFMINNKDDKEKRKKKWKKEQ